MAKKVKMEHVEIKAPNLQVAVFAVRGILPYVQSRFSQKAREDMKVKQEAGSVARKGTKREPKDFKAMYEGSMYKGPKGERGIPAAAFRDAMISACRIVGYKMTQAKMSVFVLPDFFDKHDHTPLVKFRKGNPEYFESYVRIGMGSTDISARAMWAPGWEVKLQVKYDADQFTVQDVTNLLMRAGFQVGVGCGRHFSKDSTGCGWGEFELVSKGGKQCRA